MHRTLGVKSWKYHFWKKLSTEHLCPNKQSSHFGGDLILVITPAKQSYWNQCRFYSYIKILGRHRYSDHKTGTYIGSFYLSYHMVLVFYLKIHIIHFEILNIFWETWTCWIQIQLGLRSWHWLHQTVIPHVQLYSQFSKFKSETNDDQEEKHKHWNKVKRKLELC